MPVPRRPPPSRAGRRRAGIVGCLVAAVAGCGPGPSAARELPEGFDACRLPGGLAARCGTVSVPLEPVRPEAGTVDLAVAVVPARRPREDAPPVYLLAGGPGQAAIAAFGPLVPHMGDLAAEHDLVLVDARGTGRSSAMTCPAPEDPAHRLEPVPDLEALEACLEGLPLDPRHVTTEHMVADLEAVRRALGHGQVTLVGVSYGTRLALAYLRRHAPHVSAAVLDGVAPPQMVLFEDFAPDGQAALDGRLAACAADPDCGGAFADLAARFEAALDALGAEPRTVRLDDPRTGEDLEVVATRSMVAALVRGLLYPADLVPLLPYTLDRFAAGDLAPLLAQGLVFADDVEGTMADATMLSVVCAEDVPFVDPARAAAKARGTFLGTALVDLLGRVCARWPRGAVPDDVKAPVAADVPVLLLSGQFDPATPPRWAELAARTLPSAVHLVVPGAGHGTLTAGCVPDLAADFLADPAAFARRDPSCLEDVPPRPFFVDAGGPPP